MGLIVLLASQIIVISIAVAAYRRVSYALKTLDRDVVEIRGALEEIRSALEKKKSLDSASYELREFLQDVMEHGCGIVKISPDAIFIRGLRK